ncbi:DNA polymerase III subunit beta [Cryptosporangium japonicum]|uniref:Beta sliding clamp n=1 Tax=Cryptosporangium japonicum TaxID=80872 RepID=A0ABN0UDW1_9ACTN
MRFRVKRELLTEAVTWGTRCAVARPVTPALGGALLSLTGGEFTVASLDGESSARITVAVEAGVDGAALVSARLLVEITKALPDQAIDVELTAGVLRLRCGAGRFGLPTMPAEEYPRRPELRSSTGTVDPAVFGAAVAQVAVAASREESLPILTCVRVAVEGSRMTLLASDRYRVSRCELPWQPADPKRTGEYLVAARPLLEAARAFAPIPAELAIVVDDDAFGGGTIGFTAAGRQLTARLFEGTFPPMGRLIDAPRPAAVTASAAELTEVVKRVALFADRLTPVVLRLEPGALTVEARGAQDAEASETIEADYTGRPTTLAFNETYLLDGLRAVGGPAVTLSFDDPHKPVSLSPRGASGSAYVLQPVRVKDQLTE